MTALTNLREVRLRMKANERLDELAPAVLECMGFLYEDGHREFLVRDITEVLISAGEKRSMMLHSRVNNLLLEFGLEVTGKQPNRFRLPPQFPVIDGLKLVRRASYLQLRPPMPSVPSIPSAFSDVKTFEELCADDPELAAQHEESKALIATMEAEMAGGAQ